MSFTQDIHVREVLKSKLVTLGDQQAGNPVNERLYDLTGFTGYGFRTDNKVQIVQGESSVIPLLQGSSWVEFFIVKSPNNFVNRSRCGLIRKSYIFTIWVKTDSLEGVVFNEALSSLIEGHFKKNTHLPMPDGSVVTILDSYQQATITRDSESGRHFNRVFIECENYYNNNN